MVATRVRNADAPVVLLRSMPRVDLFEVYRQSDPIQTMAPELARLMHMLPDDHRKAVESANTKIQTGSEHYKKSVNPDTEPDRSYCAIIEAATNFRQATLLLSGIADVHYSMSNGNRTVADALRLAADLADNLEAEAIKIERLQRPGRSAQFERSPEEKRSALRLLKQH